MSDKILFSLLLIHMVLTMTSTNSWSTKERLADETKVTFVLHCLPTTGAHETGKAQYLEEQMKQIQTIKTIKLKEVEYDDRMHPTETGTKQIIEQLQAELGDQIVLDEAEQEEITTPRKYSLVKPIYKVGCRGCDSIEFTATLCRNCIAEAANVDASYLEQMVEKLEEDLFPFLDAENDVQMTKILKRGSNDEENEQAKTKNPRVQLVEQNA